MDHGQWRRLAHSAQERAGLYGRATPARPAGLPTIHVPVNAVTPTFGRRDVSKPRTRTDKMPPVSGAGHSNDITKKPAIPYSHRPKTRDLPHPPDRRKEHPYAAYLAATTAAREAKAQQMKLRRQWNKTDGIQVTERVEEEREQVKKKKKQIVASSAELAQRLKQMQQAYQKRTYQVGMSQKKSSKSPPSDKPSPSKPQGMAEARKAARKCKSSDKAKSPTAKKIEPSCSQALSKTVSASSPSYGNAQSVRPKYVPGRSVMKSTKGISRRSAGRVFQLGSTPPKRQAQGTNYQDEPRGFPRVTKPAQHGDSPPKMSGVLTRTRHSKDKLIPLPVHPRNRGTSCEDGMSKQCPQNNQDLERPQTDIISRNVPGWSSELEARLFMYQPDTASCPMVPDPLPKRKLKGKRVPFSSQKLEREDDRENTADVARNVSDRSLSQSDGETFNELRIRTLLQEFGFSDENSPLTTMRSEEGENAQTDHMSLSQKGSKTSKEHPDENDSVTDSLVQGRTARRKCHSKTKRSLGRKRKKTYPVHSLHDHVDSSSGLYAEASDTETPGSRASSNGDDHTEGDKHDNYHRKVSQEQHARDLLTAESYGFDSSVVIGNREKFRMGKDGTCLQRDSFCNDFSLQKKEEQNMPPKHGGSSSHTFASESSSMPRVPSTEGDKQDKQKQPLTRDSFWDDDIVDASEEDASYRIVARAMNQDFSRDDNVFMRTPFNTSTEETASQSTLSTSNLDYELTEKSQFMQDHDDSDRRGISRLSLDQTDLPMKSSSKLVTRDSPAEVDASEGDFDYSECFSTGGESCTGEHRHFASLQSNPSDEEEAYGARFCSMSKNSCNFDDASKDSMLDDTTHERSGQGKINSSEKSTAKPSISHNDDDLNYTDHNKESEGQNITSTLALGSSRPMMQESKPKSDKESLKLKSGGNQDDDLYDFSDVYEGPVSSFDSSKGSYMQNLAPLKLEGEKKKNKAITPVGGATQENNYSALQKPQSDNDNWDSKPVQHDEYFSRQESSSEQAQLFENKRTPSSNLADLNALFSNDDDAQLGVTSKDKLSKTSIPLKKVKNSDASGIGRQSAGSHKLREQVAPGTQLKTSQPVTGAHSQESKGSKSMTTEGKKEPCNGSAKGSRYKRQNRSGHSWPGKNQLDDPGLDDWNEMHAQKVPRKGACLETKSPLKNPHKTGSHCAVPCFKADNSDWPTSDESSPEEKYHGSSSIAGAQHKMFRESKDDEKSVLRWPDSDSDDTCPNGYPLTCRSLGYSPNKSKQTPDAKEIGFDREEKEPSPQVEMGSSCADSAALDQTSRMPTPSSCLHTPEPWWKGYGSNGSDSSSPDLDTYGMDSASMDKTPNYLTPRGSPACSPDKFKIQHAQEAWWKGSELEEERRSSDVDVDDSYTELQTLKRTPRLLTSNESLGYSPIKSKIQHSPEPWWTTEDREGREASSADEMEARLTELVALHPASASRTPSSPLGCSSDKSMIQHAQEAWWQGSEKDKEPSPTVDTDQFCTELVKLNQSYRTPDSSPGCSPNKSTFQHGQEAWWQESDVEEKEPSPRVEMDISHTELVILDQAAKASAPGCASPDGSPRQTLQGKRASGPPNAALFSPEPPKSQDNAGERPEVAETPRIDEIAPLSPGSLDESVTLDIATDEETEKPTSPHVYKLEVSSSYKHLDKDHMKPHDNASHENLCTPTDDQVQNGPVNKRFTGDDQDDHLRLDQSERAEYTQNYADNAHNSMMNIEYQQDADELQTEEPIGDLLLEDVDDDWDSSDVQGPKPARLQQGILEIENLDDVSLDDVEDTETEQLPATITPRRSQPYLGNSSQRRGGMSACGRPQSGTSIFGASQPEATASHPPGAACPPLLFMCTASQPTLWGVNYESATAWKEKNDHCTYLSDSSCSDVEQCKLDKSSDDGTVISISTSHREEEEEVLGNESDETNAADDKSDSSD